MEECKSFKGNDTKFVEITEKLRSARLCTFTAEHCRLLAALKVENEAVLTTYM